MKRAKVRCGQPRAIQRGSQDFIVQKQDNIMIHCCSIALKQKGHINLGYVTETSGCNPSDTFITD